jgi:hypothetical protein
MYKGRATKISPCAAIFVNIGFSKRDLVYDPRNCFGSERLFWFIYAEGSPEKAYCPLTREEKSPSCMELRTHHYIRKSPPLVSIRSRMNPIHTISPPFF